MRKKIWREHHLLANHTLMAVISFPDELFYPAALKQVVAIIVKKGIPHREHQPVFWARIVHDGYIKLKSCRLDASELKPPRQEANNLLDILPSLQGFLVNPLQVVADIPMLCKTCPIDFDDPLLELLPEAYIDSDPITQEEIERAVDELARETVAFLIRFKKESDVEAWDDNN